MVNANCLSEDKQKAVVHQGSILHARAAQVLLPSLCLLHAHGRPAERSKFEGQHSPQVRKDSRENQTLTSRSEKMTQTGFTHLKHALEYGFEAGKLREKFLAGFDQCPQTLLRLDNKLLL